MKLNRAIGIVLLALAVISIVLASQAGSNLESTSPSGEPTRFEIAPQRVFAEVSTSAEPPLDDPTSIQLVQYLQSDGCQSCANGCQEPCSCGPTGFETGDAPCPGNCNMAIAVESGAAQSHLRPSQLTPTCQPMSEQAPGPVKSILGVNEFVCNKTGREPTFQDSQLVPWEMFGYGEYVGPHRTPHVPEYRLRVNDTLEFVYYLTRRQSIRPYQIFVGDALQISSASDASVNQERITVLPDGTISLPLVGQIRAASKTISDLQDELNDAYLKYLKNPSILVQVIDGNTPLKDIRDAVDSRFGSGGQTRQSIVSPDGTVQLPVVGSVPAVGLTLDEIRREVNARYRDLAEGIEVTPVLLTRAPRFVYVIGQVAQPGRYELVGPTTVMQAIALAQGDLQGGNLRNVVVFRRDEQWRLTATRLDLAGAIYGRRPFPSDEIYLRDSDIVLLPRKPIQRLSEAADLYLTRTLYAIFPEVVVFDLQDSVVSGGN